MPGDGRLKMRVAMTFEYAAREACTGLIVVAAGNPPSLSEPGISGRTADCN